MSPHTQERHELLDSCQRIVCYRLGISPVQYIDVTYEAMHRYLALRPGLADWDEVRNYIAHSQLFKRWWLNQWLNRELQWINAIERTDELSQLWDSWRWLHSPRMLAGGIHPASTQLEHSYSDVIHLLLKQANRAPANAKSSIANF